ncbi:hypothetical protein BH09MYX1_BH09MYX1_28410 [soil metagenome]
MRALYLLANTMMFCVSVGCTTLGVEAERQPVDESPSPLSAVTKASKYEFPIHGQATVVDVGEGERYQTATEGFTWFRSTNAVSAWSAPTAPQMSVGWPASMAEHDAMARAYVIRVGVPSTELGQVYHFHGHAYATSLLQPTVAPTTTELGFSTTFARTYAGYLVLDSHAGVQLNVSGVPVSLGIEWPDVPSAVVQEASTLRSSLASGWKAGPKSLGGRNLVGTQVVIRHSFAGGGAGVAMQWRAVMRTESISFDGMHTYLDTDVNEKEIVVVDTSKAHPSNK